MAIRVISVLKSWFETGKKPTQAQYSDVFDSLMHRTDGAKLALDRVEGLTAALEEAGTGGGGDGSNLYNADGVIPEATERLVEIEESANIAFTGTKSVTNIGDAGFESISRDISGNESAIENRGGAVVHRSDLNEPLKSEAYYAPTSDNHYAQRKFVLDKIAEIVNSSPAALDTLNELAAALGNDANFATTVTNALALKAATTYVDIQDNKQNPAIGIFVTATTADSGATYTGTTSTTLATFPKIFSLRGVALNLLIGNSTININSTGAIKVKDIDGNEINGALLNNKDYTCYYDNVGDGTTHFYRILNHNESIFI